MTDEKVLYMKAQAQRVFDLLRFVKDWNREDAAECLGQASKQMAMMPDGASVEELIEELQKVVDHIEVNAGKRH